MLMMLNLTLISLPFKPQTKDELQTAVDLWESDNASALTSYGEIRPMGCFSYYRYDRSFC